MDLDQTTNDTDMDPLEDDSRDSPQRKPVPDNLGDVSPHAMLEIKMESVEDCGDCESSFPQFFCEVHLKKLHQELKLEAADKHSVRTIHITSPALSLRLKSEHGIIKYPCDNCDYAARSRANLRRHQKVKHEGLRYPCDQCGYLATELRYLKQHKKTVHDGVRYPCERCDYLATQPIILKQHVKCKHDGVRYPCDECDLDLTQTKQLQKIGMFMPCHALLQLPLYLTQISWYFSSVSYRIT